MVVDEAQFEGGVGAVAADVLGVLGPTESFDVVDGLGVISVGDALQNSIGFLGLVLLKEAAYYFLGIFMNSITSSVDEKQAKDQGCYVT